MPTSVTMPQLGESVTEGTVTRWLKQEGDEVQADEPLLEVSTDKVDTEIPAPASGVLRKIMVAEDETVQVGAELAIIGGADEDAGSADSGGAEQASAEQAQSDEQASAEQEKSDEPPAGSDRSEPAPAAESADAPAEQEQPQPAAAEAPASTESSDNDSDDARSGGAASGTSVTMPALGESVTEGTVTRWLKSVGDSVQADEPLLEVSTDKVDTEIPAPTSGTLLSVAVGEDETVQVGAELAVIGSGDGSGSASAPAQPQTQTRAETAPPAAQPQAAEPQAAEPEAAEPPPAPRDDAEAAPDAQPPSESPAQPRQPAQDSAPSHASGASADGGAYVTPLVRKLAAEHKVDLGSVSGTGVGGRIRKQDVLEAASGATRTPGAPASAQPVAATQPEAAPAAPAATSASAGSAPDLSMRGRTEKLTRLRALIGRRMTESLQVSAQLTTVVEVDLTRVARLRDRVKQDFLAREGAKLSFLPFFALAAVEALKAHPMVNSSIDSEAGTVTYHESENLGIAVDTERGLLVPVIHNAGDLNLGGIARKIADLADRTRNNKVMPDELGGGTFTLTNTGSRGALFDTPIINQPQVGILGTGTVVKRPVVVDDPDLGEIITVRSMVYLALTYDHRIVDGADAARFLVTIKDRLEAGDFESSLGLS
ncbi:MAG: 2-oxoglutarate dehydrogenase, E2 component, dihydrolipoamide succinyltransferase [Actinomycetota bacterium]|nr:2-oxoglutarate dehydrogenase, E2 component, dihydrolipoamide succinyltransferase [Actinomycetota bacterium]